MSQCELSVTVMNLSLEMLTIATRRIHEAQRSANFTTLPKRRRVCDLGNVYFAQIPVIFSSASG